MGPTGSNGCKSASKAVRSVGGSSRRARSSRVRGEKAGIQFHVAGCGFGAGGRRLRGRGGPQSRRRDRPGRRPPPAGGKLGSIGQKGGPPWSNGNPSMCRRPHNEPVLGYTPGESGNEKALRAELDPPLGGQVIGDRARAIDGASDHQPAGRQKPSWPHDHRHVPGRLVQGRRLRGAARRFDRGGARAHREWSRLPLSRPRGDLPQGRRPPRRTVPDDLLRCRDDCSASPRRAHQAEIDARPARLIRTSGDSTSPSRRRSIAQQPLSSPGVWNRLRAPSARRVSCSRVTAVQLHVDRRLTLPTAPRHLLGNTPSCWKPASVRRSTRPTSSWRSFEGAGGSAARRHSNIGARARGADIG